MPADPDAAPEAVELKPCPFCGSAAELLQDDDGRWTQVMCAGCGGKAPEVMASKEAASAAWNRRATSAADAAEVERLRAEVLELKARSAAASKRLGDLKAMISHAEDGLDGPPTMATTEHIIWSARCYLDGVRGPYLTEARSALGGAS